VPKEYGQQRHDWFTSSRRSRAQPVQEGPRRSLSLQEDTMHRDVQTQPVELFRAFSIEEIRSRRELKGFSLWSCLYYFYSGYFKN
jgi:hypothetical protein